MLGLLLKQQSSEHAASPGKSPAVPTSGLLEMQRTQQLPISESTEHPVPLSSSPEFYHFIMKKMELSSCPFIVRDLSKSRLDSPLQVEVRDITLDHWNSSELLVKFNEQLLASYKGKLVGDVRNMDGAYVLVLTFDNRNDLDRLVKFVEKQTQRQHLSYKHP